MADFPRYEAASWRNAGGAQRGVTAFMEWATKDYQRGARNVGIYNYRKVRGKLTPSLHGEGRAADVGFSGSGNPNGTALLNLLLPNVKALGIQMIIWNRRIYSAKAPLGAKYQGTASHTDHLHIEFTWAAARGLTRERVRAIVGGRVPPAPTPVPPAPAPVPKPQPQPVPQPEDDVYIRDSKTGAIYAVSATHWDQLSPAQWADRVKEGATAPNVPPEMAFHILKSRVKV